MTALQTATLKLARSKPKKCDARKGGCGTVFLPARPMQKMCGWQCAQNHVKWLNDKKAKQAAREDRRQTREQLLATMPKAKIAKAAQDAVNAYIRARDVGQPCISCGSLTAPMYQAGHYLSVGARPELRYDPDNIHMQCVQCNMHKAGNVAAYRLGLITKIGLARVERLEGPHPMPNWSRDDLMQIKQNAQKMLAELKTSRR